MAVDVLAAIVNSGECQLADGEWRDFRYPIPACCAEWAVVWLIDTRLIAPRRLRPPRRLAPRGWHRDTGEHWIRSLKNNYWFLITARITNIVVLGERFLKFYMSKVDTYVGPYLGSN